MIYSSYDSDMKISNTNLEGGNEKPSIMIMNTGDKMETFISKYKEDSYELPCLINRPIYGGVIDDGGVNNILVLLPAHILANHHKVDYKKGTKGGTGYQRPVSKSRVNKVASRLIAEHIDLPLSVTLNLRSENAFHAVKNGTFKYMPDVHGELYISDGQHRALGIREAFNRVLKAIDENKDRTEVLGFLENLQIPALICFAQNITKEIKIFGEINSNSKGVPVDMMVSNLMTSANLHDDSEIDRAKFEGKFWQIGAGNILEKVTNNYDSVWYKRIKFPGEEGILTPNVGIASMSKYLKVILDSPQAMMASDKQTFVREAFEAYWEGCRLVAPEMFEDPKKYTIQKALGADVMMRMWVYVVEWNNQNNSNDKQNLREASTYKKALDRMFSRMPDEDSDGNTIRGFDFWKTGGLSGTYSSEKGKGALLEIMKEALIRD